jgi:hypothetical protein
MSPQVVNKIRQNSGDFAGDSKAMKEAFKNGEILGDEIIEIGGGLLAGNPLIIEDGKLHLAEQEKICADLDKAMTDAITRQRALNNKRRQWLDTKL